MVMRKYCVCLMYLSSLSVMILLFGACNSTTQLSHTVLLKPLGFVLCTSFSLQYYCFVKCNCKIELKYFLIKQCNTSLEIGIIFVSNFYILAMHVQYSQYRVNRCIIKFQHWKTHMQYLQPCGSLTRWRGSIYVSRCTDISWFITSFISLSLPFGR